MNYLLVQPVKDAMKEYADFKVNELIKSNVIKPVCPKCKFEPMIKVDDRYNCEMCGYVEA